MLQAIFKYEEHPRFEMGKSYTVISWTKNTLRLEDKGQILDVHRQDFSFVEPVSEQCIAIWDQKFEQYRYALQSTN